MVKEALHTPHTPRHRQPSLPPPGPPPRRKRHLAQRDRSLSPSGPPPRKARTSGSARRRNLQSRRMPGSLSPGAPPRLRSASPTGAPRRKRAKLLDETEKDIPKVRVVAWLADGLAPIECPVSPDVGGEVRLSRYRIPFGKRGFEEQRAVEHCVPHIDGTFAWERVFWDDPAFVFAETSRVLVRYEGVTVLNGWKKYMP
ncbi:hypothetical protein R3P38DRAFT_3235302 [Favolaschia claudopus]|uniref:Uncharacterized protein n=1 Tax=Favolaschia claudopus TaxID=2862362 RepID=A0AAV9ZF34_9AGAR